RAAVDLGGAGLSGTGDTEYPEGEPVWRIRILVRAGEGAGHRRFRWSGADTHIGCRLTPGTRAPESNVARRRTGEWLDRRLAGVDAGGDQLHGSRSHCSDGR